MKPLNILFVSEYFYPRAAGGEVWAWELCTELAKRGHKITVITTNHDDLKTAETVQGVRILRPVKSPKHIGNRVGRWLANKRLIKHVEQYIKVNKGIDLVHTMAYGVNVPVSRLAKRHSIPCITAVHSFFGKDWSIVLPLPFMRWQERMTIEKDESTLMHVPSEYLRKRIKEETGRETAVVHNWLPEKFPKPRKFGQPTLLFVGSLERVKDPLACIPVAKRLDMPLVVIGSGSLEEDLLRDAQRAGIDCAVRPHATREQTLAAIGGAAMVLIPSVTESFSLVALEAIAQGTPVAGNAVGILSELPGVVAWPPKKVSPRVSKAQSLNVVRTFAKKIIVQKIELIYRRAKT